VVLHILADVTAYEIWGRGQIGIINLGNIPIHREHLEAAGNAVIDRDSPWDPVEAFTPVVLAAKAGGSLCIGQLTHGGRQVSNLIRES
jgi:2,4-dienoyl-CoA reductase-like NADH-dependent reductase (Old Yellow Enzyme family)